MHPATETAGMAAHLQRDATDETARATRNDDAILGHSGDVI